MFGQGLRRRGMLLVANMRPAFVADQNDGEKTRGGRRVGEERPQADQRDQSQPIPSYRQRKLRTGRS